MVRGYGVGDLLEEDGLSGLGRRDDERPLSLADGAEEVDDPGGEFLGRSLKVQFLVGVEGREILERNTVLRHRRLVIVDQFDSQHGEEAFALFGAPYLAVDSVAGLEVKEPYLGGGDVDVVGAREIGVLGRAQEAVAVRQDLQRSVGVDDAAFLGVRLEGIEDEFLLAQGDQLLMVDPVLFAQLP